MVHRLLKKYSKEKINYKNISHLEGELTEISEHCTERERLAMDAERASVKLFQTILASNYMGKEFMGTISGVMSFGIFILLDEIFSEGLLNFRDMADDYYYLDEKNHRVIGKRKKREYSFGKRLKVKIIRVNIEKRRIDLTLVT
jgi:ribonuclease R